MPMNSRFHSKQSILSSPPDEIHAPISYVFSNAAARLTSGPYTKFDGYKLAIDIDTNEINILINWIVPTWKNFGGTDNNAFHNNISNEISSLSLKPTPNSGDFLLIEDSEDSSSKKYITISTLPGGTPADNSITFAKIQNITSDRLLGRDTASSGDVEEISVSGGLEWTGSGGIQRSAITGDVTISAGSNTATVTDLTITSEAQGDILYRNATNWVRLAASADGYVLTTHSTSANPTWQIPGFRYVLSAEDFISPVSSDWAVNALASLSADSAHSGLSVRLFDATTAEGVGFGFTVPVGATNMIFSFKSRAASTPGGTVGVQPTIYIRTIPDNSAVGSWSAGLDLTPLSFTTNTFFQYNSQTVSLSTLGLSTGNYIQFELTRKPSDGNDTLASDWCLLELVVEFR